MSKLSYLQSDTQQTHADRWLPSIFYQLLEGWGLQENQTLPKATQAIGSIHLLV